MINFFRKVRKKLANENKFQKYFRYAFGEVTLIMIGIFMALQLNNWNENRKQEAQFKVNLEQLYNVLHVDVETFEGQNTYFKQRINDINFLLEFPDSIQDSHLPYILFSFSRDDLIDDYNSDAIYHSKNLNFSLNNVEQNEMSKQITFYIKEISKKHSYGITDINDLFDKQEIAYPKFIDDNLINGLIFNDSTFYKEKEIEKLITFKNSAKYTPILKKIKFYNVIYEGLSYHRNKIAESLIRNIKTYYPDVKLIFSDVGIIGTSLDGFDDVGGRSTPMTLTDGNNNIWEATLFLKKGKVKFRCNDTWIQSWGGDDFPKGEAIYNHGDITVNGAGNYHIILNLSKNTYEFIKLEDD